jgi:alpha-methylacyl-CoA racemase
MTGWGQDGSLARQPGHDINFIALAGALGAIGPAGGDPAVPLNVVGDMGGGGLLLATGITAALLAVKATGEGQVVDAAMTDGTAIQLASIWGLAALGRWQDRRGANLLDGGAPFYRVYRCADGGHVAVGCLEPEFYAALLRVLELSGDPLFGDQYDESAWPAMSDRLAEIFGGRSRDDWSQTFGGQAACVTPVLGLAEAAAHPHNASRRTYAVDKSGVVHPHTAPRFLGTPSGLPTPARVVGADTDDVLAEARFDPAAIDRLRADGVVA